MSSYKINDKAKSDLDGIWDYTVEKWSYEQATRYFNLLLNEIEKIAQNPTLGRAYVHVENCRRYKVKSHYIFYEIISDEHVEILRILHERMDMENRLLD